MLFLFLQLITFQNVDPDGQINDVIQTITTTDAEKSMVPDINFAIDHFQDLYPDCKLLIRYSVMYFKMK